MPAPIELLEREAQLSRLSRLLEEARGGEGRVALVYGEAGIGKTALVTEFTRVHARDLRLFWGACDPLSTPRPLAPLLDIAWTQGGSLSGRIAAGAPREEIFQAFFEALRSPKPLAVVVIEDLHWADDATLDLVKFLGRRAQRATALIVLTWRDEGMRPDHPLRASIGDLPPQVVTRIPLPGLSPAAVESLGARARRSTAGLHAATNGNPFFVTEVLASDEAGVPATVRDAVLARAARLRPQARALCELVAVVPSRIDLPLLQAAAGPTFTALDELLVSGIVSVSDGEVSFRHELARKAVEDALPPLRKRELHARVLAPLRAHGEEPSQLAVLVHHAAGAGDSASVLSLAPRAAEHASQLGAHREAEAHLAMALRHAGALPPRSLAELLDAHGRECYLVDRMREGLESFSKARELWQQLGDRVREGNSLSWLARSAWFTARPEDAERYADLAIEVLESQQRGPELAMAWLTRALLFISAADAKAAIGMGESALQIARELKDREIEAHALNMISCARIQAGDQSGWGLMDESLRLSLSHNLEDAAGRAYANLGTLAIEERRHDLAARILDEGIAYAVERDLRTRILCMYGWRARLRVEIGRWAEAVEDTAHVLDNPGASALFRLVALTPLGLLRTRRGDPGAREALDEALALARQSGDLERTVPVAAARAELCWLSGDASGAAAEAAAVIERARKSRRPWHVADLAVWIWRGGGEPPPARECARPVALQLEGDWRAAAEEFEKLGCPYHAALARYDSDDPDAMLAALEVLDRLEARPAAARVRRRLADLGVRAVPRGPRSARRGHPFGLTAREQEVLDALALGLSNAEIAARLFVSPKTVDHHVSAILEKLDVSSRGAAVAKARNHSLSALQVAPAK
ncbi:MAG TPA: AAA family ATPase [Myxococcales bacterium]|nr:AAA family ATPase [Myxococcales bacterium]